MKMDSVFHQSSARVITDELDVEGKEVSTGDGRCLYIWDSISIHICASLRSATKRVMRKRIVFAIDQRNHTLHTICRG